MKKPSYFGGKSNINISEIEMSVGNLAVDVKPLVYQYFVHLHGQGGHLAGSFMH